MTKILHEEINSCDYCPYCQEKYVPTEKYWDVFNKCPTGYVCIKTKTILKTWSGSLNRITIPANCPLENL